jgi:transposase
VSLSDPQWSLIEPLLAPTTSRGRPSLDKRPILEAIFWKFTSRQPWYDISSTSPSWQTCYQHYHRWHHTGIWKSIIETLMLDLYTRGAFDLQHALDNRDILIKNDPSGKVAFIHPPQLTPTWQLTTAILILYLLSSDL